MRRFLMLVSLLMVLNCGAMGQAGKLFVPVVWLGTGGEFGLLLGGGQGAKWVALDKAQKLVKGRENYRFYANSGKIGDRLGAKAATVYSGTDGIYVRFASNPDPKQSLIGIGGSWNALPRMVRGGDTSQKIYLDEVAKVLKQKGITPAEPHIDKLWAVDLDGKKRDCVLIEASQKNYSFVLARIYNGKNVQTFLLEGEFVTKKGENLEVTRHLSHVLDLNGDGVMEVLTQWQEPEGAGIVVYSFLTGKPVRVLEAGDGL